MAGIKYSTAKRTSPPHRIDNQFKFEFRVTVASMDFSQRQIRALMWESGISAQDCTRQPSLSGTYLGLNRSWSVTCAGKGLSESWGSRARDTDPRPTVLYKHSKPEVSFEFSHYFLFSSSWSLKLKPLPSLWLWVDIWARTRLYEPWGESRMSPTFIEGSFILAVHPCRRSMGAQLRKAPKSLLRAISGDHQICTLSQIGLGLYTG